MKIDGVLLDLDGTLADTAPDLVAVLNRLLAERGRVRMPYAIARNEVSNGAAGLIRLGFGAIEDPDAFDALRRRFLEVYAEMLCRDSRLFIGLDPLHDALGEIKWGIVTNKPEAFTRPLLEALGVTVGAHCVISGDRLPQRKPHPAPLLLGAEELGVRADRCVYFGDALRDVEAGRAAGMATVIAAYGYIRPREDIAAWGADAVLRRPEQFAQVLAELEMRSRR